MTPKEHLLKCKNDFPWFCKTYLKIKNKKGELVPFVLNKAQLALDAEYEKAKREGRPMWFIVLKARQMGFSTYIVARGYHNAIFRFGITCAIIAHIKKASRNLFRMSKRYHNNMPSFFKPHTQNSNAMEILFSKLDSYIYIDTAENREAVGRSDTIHFVHASEVPSWSDASNTMAALLQTVPDKIGIVFLESTANGIGDYFHKVWKGSEEGVNNYIRVFAPWFEHEEYQKEFENEKEKTLFIHSLTEPDIKFKNLYNLTIQQLHWYKYTLENKCASDINQMHQEYPSNANEAFVASGYPHFDLNICQENYKATLDIKPKQGVLEYVYDEKGKPIDAKFVEKTNGAYSLFVEPDISQADYHKYCGGVDVAEGLEHRDNSSFEVFNRKTMAIDLTFTSKEVDPDLLAVELHKTMLFYKKVMWNIEFNNHGLTTIVSAFKLGLDIQHRGQYEYGLIVDKMELGHKTNMATKPILVDRLKVWIRERLFYHPETKFWDECCTYINDKGKTNALQGCWDDRVIRTALTIACHVWLPSYTYKEEKEIIGRKVYNPKSRESTF